jgi:hypothetical protein
MASKLNENSEITIPLRNLVSLVAFTAVSVWVYFGLAERINFLEHTMTMTIVEVEENDDWIDDFKPPEDVTRAVAQVHELEIKVAEILHRIETLEGR